MAMQATDVAIVGAGIFWLSAAWACLDRGLSVAVYDKDTVGGGASGGIVGALSPHMPEAWNPKKEFQLNALLAAPAHWSRVAEVSGVDPGFGHVGRILPLRSAKAAELAAARSAAAIDLWRGQAMFRVTSASHGISAPYGVVHETLTARLYPKHAVRSLATALRHRGVRIMEHHPVPDLSLLPAGRVIVAAGTASGRLLPDLAPLVP